MNDVFSPKRLWLLIRKDAVMGWRTLGITTLTVSLIIFASGVIEALVQLGARGNLGNDSRYIGIFIGMLFIWGLISASRAFRELHDKNANDDFLLLPASSSEKAVERLLWTLIALPLFILVLVTLLSFITEGFNGLVLKRFNAVFNPFDPIIWKVMGHFIIAHAVFFLGAAWFKKAHLVKTVLTLGIIGMLLGLVAIIIFRIAFAGYFEGFFTPIHIQMDVEPIILGKFPNLLNTLTTLSKVLYYGLITPFCWVVAWLRVKETQVSHGV